VTGVPPLAAVAAEVRARCRGEGLGCCARSARSRENRASYLDEADLGGGGYVGQPVSFLRGQSKLAYGRILPFQNNSRAARAMLEANAARIVSWSEQGDVISMLISPVQNMFVGRIRGMAGKSIRAFSSGSSSAQFVTVGFRKSVRCWVVPFFFPADLVAVPAW